VFRVAAERRNRQRKIRYGTIICFACLARLPYMWALSANRIPACPDCTHCLPAAVEGVIAYYL